MADNVIRNPPARAVYEQNGHRRAELESLRNWATSLLTVAKHDTMKDYLRLVIGDLGAGFQLLLPKNGHDDPAVWAIVDLAITRARLSLRVITDTFERVGTDAAFKPAEEPRRPPWFDNNART